MPWTAGSRARPAASAAEPRRYVPFESFEHQIERDRGREARYYRVRVRDSLRGDGFDHDISFVRGDEQACLGCARPSR